jgi:hypothetical protein
MQPVWRRLEALGIAPLAEERAAPEDKLVEEIRRSAQDIRAGLAPAKPAAAAAETASD